MEGYNAKLLILEAYGLKNYQVSFASPSPWVDDFYDIEAKAEGDGLPTRAEFREMIQTLLADRFKIKIHREMREMPVYELTLDKNGLRLKPGERRRRLRRTHRTGTPHGPQLPVSIHQLHPRSAGGQRASGSPNPG
jgi:uncharacterized protein (TIGR03435 family)